MFIDTPTILCDTCIENVEGEYVCLSVCDIFYSCHCECRSHLEITTLMVIDPPPNPPGGRDGRNAVPTQTFKAVCGVVEH